MKTDISGSGNVTLKGYAASNQVMMGGAGSLNAFNLELENATVKVSGSGNAELNVTNSLEASVLGTGSIKHKGNTKNLSKKAYGTGTIERAY